MKLSDLFKKKESSNMPPHEMPKFKTSIRMQDGTIEEHPTDFIITDKKNCVICPDYPFKKFKLYHIYFNCEGLKYECQRTGNIPQACDVKDMKAQDYTLCMTCSKALYEHNKSLR